MSIARMLIQKLESEHELDQTAAIDFTIVYHRPKSSGNCDGHTTELNEGGWFYSAKETPRGWYLYQRCKICGKGFKHGPVKKPVHI